MFFWMQHCRTLAFVLVDTGTGCDRCCNFCCDKLHKRSHYDSGDSTQGTSGYNKSGKKTIHSSRSLINVHNQIQCLSLNHFLSVPLHHPGPTSSAISVASAAPPLPSQIAPSQTPMKYLYWTIRHLSNHPLFPHLTIRQSPMPSDANKYNQIPLQLSSRLQARRMSMDEHPWCIATYPLWAVVTSNKLRM